MKKSKLHNLILEAYAEVISELNEAPDGMFYFEVAIRDAKKAMGIMHDKYDKQFEMNGSNVYYFTDESIAYDAMMDLGAKDIEFIDSNLDEALGHNDPALMKLRADKMKRDKFAGQDPKAGSMIRGRGFDPIILKLKAKRAQVMRDMEQEAEPEGGPIADKYGDMLNKIDAAIAKARGLKEDDETDDYGRPHVDPKGSRTYIEPEDMLPSKRFKDLMKESLLDDLSEEEEEPQPEEEPDNSAGPETVLEDATDTILSKFPTVKQAIIKLQTEDFKEFVDSIDWISPRPTSFRINLKNGQDYILKWTGKTFEAQILGKRYLLSNISDYQQAIDKLALLYKEAPMKGAGEEDIAADTDTGGGGGGGGDFPGEEGGAEGGEDLGGDDAGGDLGGDEGGEDLSDEPIDFESGEEG